MHIMNWMIRFKPRKTPESAVETTIVGDAVGAMLQFAAKVHTHGCPEHGDTYELYGPYGGATPSLFQVTYLVVSGNGGWVCNG